ncbi:SHOCT domain-containing protein [Haloplanus halobius]|uniref:SHOCT domain-containing protein n=1 Tax=Haloplanus halobius TaxID=2934938 RepID=UPI0020107234|nr:SHOCT domain-containing protein [Haloplanus sp. XH21]
MQLPTLSGLAPLAQWHPGPHGPGPHGPHWGGAGTGMGTGAGVGVGGGWLLTLLLVVLLLVVVAAVLLYAVRTVDARDVGADEEGDRALDTLRERYATGEVDDEEFERRLTRLQKTG